MTITIAICGSGFVGSELERYLSKMPDINVVFAPKEFSRSKALNEIQEEELLKFFEHKQPRCIVNVAGPTNIQESMTTPDIYTMDQLEQVKKHALTLQKLAIKPSYVYLSSGSVYGSTSEFGVDELTPTNPLSPYAHGKILAEGYLQWAQAEFEFCSSLYIFRGFSLFSVEYPHRLFRVIYEMLQGLQEPTLYGDGNELRDFVSVGYFSKIIQKIAVSSTPPLSGLYNLSSGQGLSVHEICKVATDQSKTEKEITFNGIIRPGDPRYMVGLNDRLVSKFGLRPNDAMIEITELFARSFR